MKPQKRFSFLHVLMFLLLFWGWVPEFSPVLAQSQVNRWDIPQNISKSGESLNPILGADSNGDLHAFWADPRSGVYYAYTTSEGWTSPKKASFPIPREVMTSNLMFQHASPRLVRSIGTRMYLFWKDENFLVFNIGNVGGADKLSSWLATRLIARFVTHYDVQVDEEGVVHLAYLQAEDYANAPAGIYYTQSLDFGGTWSQPVLIYASNYFRSLLPVIRTGLEPPQPITNSLNLSIARAEEQKVVYLAFDQQPRKKVWVAQSMDGGKVWQSPIEVDTASSSGGIAYPENIHVVSQGENALLIWQVRQSETVCFTYFKQSENAGKTWSSNQRLDTPFLTCSEKIDVLEEPNTLPLISFYTQKLLYFATWDGTQWSEIINEPYALSFTDPETSTGISLKLFDLISRTPGEVALAGIDLNANHDVWVSTGNLEDISTWLPQNPGWKPSQVLQTTDSAITDLHIIEDQQKQWHAFWLQNEILDIPPGTLVKPIARRIAYYSYFEGKQWSLPVSMFMPSSNTGSSTTSREDEQIAQLEVAVDAENRFFAIWKNQLGGEVFFSWCTGKAPISVLDWSPPSIVYSIPVEATDLSIQLAPNHAIQILYAIPINENRGVYLVESRDLGKTWSAPLTILKGASKGWDVVSKPVLVYSADGSYHVSVVHQTMLEGNSAKGLYEIHSFDQGISWTEPENVSPNMILWHTLLPNGNNLHRLWAEKDPGDQRTILLHQISQDAGRSFGRVTRITDWEGSSSAIQATLDEAGQIHLVFLSQQPLGNVDLKYLVWNASGWDEIDALNFGILQESNLNIPLDFRVRKDGIAGVLLGLPLYNPEQQQKVTTLLGSYREVVVPPAPILPTAAPITPSSPEPTPTPNPSPTTVATSTPPPPVETSTLNPNTPPAGSTNRNIYLMIGGAFSGLLILIVLGIAGIRRLNRSRRNF